MTVGRSEVTRIEELTRGQTKSSHWFDAPRGRLTASKHHDIYTKVNTLSRARDVIKPKTTPIVAEIISPINDIQSLPDIKWRVTHEEDALKEFYAKEAIKHEGFKVNKCGLFVHSQYAYIAASPDAILSCKCHGLIAVEIKCPYNTKDDQISTNYQSCDFLKKTDTGDIILNNNHKYYIQVISQINVTKSAFAYFVIWTTKETLVLKVSQDSEHCARVSNNLSVFFMVMSVLHC